jgi:hypothetical protein
MNLEQDLLIGREELMSQPTYEDDTTVTFKVDGKLALPTTYRVCLLTRLLLLWICT